MTFIILSQSALHYAECHDHIYVRCR